MLIPHLEHIAESKDTGTIGVLNSGEEFRQKIVSTLSESVASASLWKPAESSGLSNAVETETPSAIRLSVAADNKKQSRPLSIQVIQSGKEDMLPEKVIKTAMKLGSTKLAQVHKKKEKSNSQADAEKLIKEAIVNQGPQVLLSSAAQAVLCSSFIQTFSISKLLYRSLETKPVHLAPDKIPSGLKPARTAKSSEKETETSLGNEKRSVSQSFLLPKINPVSLLEQLEFAGTALPSSKNSFPARADQMSKHGLTPLPDCSVDISLPLKQLESASLNKQGIEVSVPDIQMGEIHLRAIMDKDGKVHATVLADTSHTRELVQNSISQISSFLESEYVRVDTITVAQTSHNSLTGGMQDGGSPSSRQQQHTKENEAAKAFIATTINPSPCRASATNQQRIEGCSISLHA